MTQEHHRDRAQELVDILRALANQFDAEIQNSSIRGDLNNTQEPYEIVYQYVLK